MLVCCHQHNNEDVPKHSLCTDHEREEEERHLESGAFPNPSRRNCLGDVWFSHSPFSMKYSFPLLLERAPMREGM